MKKQKQPLELDDIDLDVDGDDGIVFNGSSNGDEDIIELTDEILDELADEDLLSDQFDFDTEELHEGKAPATAGVSGQTSILEDDDLMDDDLLSDDMLSELSFGDEHSDVEGAGTLGVFEKQLEKDSPEDLEDDLFLNIGEASDDRPVEEVGFLDAEDPDLGMGLSVVPPAAAALAEGLPETMEPALDEIIDQLEARMTSYVQQVIEARLPDLVRSLLKEEIERLKQELQ